MSGGDADSRANRSANFEKLQISLEYSSLLGIVQRCGP